MTFKGLLPLGWSPISMETFQSLMYFGRASAMGDWCVVYGDRFLCLYWDASYTSRVTMVKALCVSFGLKFCIILLTIFNYIAMDVDNCGSTNGTSSACEAFFKAINVYFFTLPTVLALIIMVSVTGYVVFKVVKLQKTVAPKPNLPMQNLNRAQNPEETNNQGNENVNSCVPRVRVNDWVNNVDEATLETAKKILNVNIPTLVCIFMLVPINAVTIFMKLTPNSCQITIYRVMFEITIAATGFLILVYFYITDKRLTKMSQTGFNH